MHWRGSLAFVANVESVKFGDLGLHRRCLHVHIMMIIENLIRSLNVLMNLATCFDFRIDEKLAYSLNK